MADSIKLNDQKVVSPSSGYRGVSDTAELENYFRTEYPESWNERFYEINGIYSYTKKVQFRGKYLPVGYKITRAAQNSYSMGTTFGRQGGDTSMEEDYNIPAGGSIRLGERITGQVYARTYMTIIHLSEDFIYKAENSNTEFDLLADMFNDMEIVETHKQKTRIYLDKTGKISDVASILVGGSDSAAGTVTALDKDTAASPIFTFATVAPNAGLIAGSGYPRAQVGTATGVTPPTINNYPVIALVVENEAYFVEGQKYFLKGKVSGTTGSEVSTLSIDTNGATADGVVPLSGVNLKLWQKDFSRGDLPVLLFLVMTDEVYGVNGVKAAASDIFTDDSVWQMKTDIGLYAVQMERVGSANTSIGTLIQPEYEGLKDYAFTKNNIVAGINRAVYPKFNPSITDLNSKILSAEALSMHLNRLDRKNPEYSQMRLISASPEALTAVENSMLQLYQYSHDPVSGKKVSLGFDEVEFYGRKLLKDPFAEHGKVYSVAEGTFAEAVYRDWEWITGKNPASYMGFMDRISQTGILEGFMKRQANSFAEDFDALSGFINVSESVSATRYSGLAAS